MISGLARLPFARNMHVKIKKSEITIEFSMSYLASSVPRTGLEPARLSPLAPETSASTIPPPGLVCGCKVRHLFWSVQIFLNFFLAGNTALSFKDSSHSREMSLFIAIGVRTKSGNNYLIYKKISISKEIGQVIVFFVTL